MNLELLKHAQGYIEKMANGINPLTGEITPSNDMINNVKISRCLFYVNDVLKEVIANGGVNKNKVKKIPFNLTLEELSKYEYTGNLAITKVVQKINALRTNENMEKLKVTEMCNWLIEIGLLQVIEENGHKLKRPTEKGQNMGMTIEHVVNEFREYDLVSYSEDVQKYTLSKSVGSGFTAYYAKLFDSEPFIRSLWRDGQDGKDGTEVTDGVHNTQRTEEIETFVEMHMQINENDVREWFEMNGNIEQARVNTIGLFTGRLASDGHGGYTASNVKLFTKFNFDNESLGGSAGAGSGGKTINFTYRIYAS